MILGMARVRRDVVSHVDLVPSRNSRDTIRISARCPVGRHQKYGTVTKICDSRPGRRIFAYAADRYACAVRMRIPGLAGNLRSVVRKSGHFVRSPVNGGSIRLMRGGCDVLTSTSGATSARQSSAG
jgi:hypothetical protein